MTKTRDKLVPDIGDLSMAGVKNCYADRIKAQCILVDMHLGSGIRRVFMARVVCIYLYKASICG